MNLKNLFKKKKIEDLTAEDLPKIWDEYCQIGYDKIFLLECFKHLNKAMTELFLPCLKGIILDGGCGTGRMFQPILEKIQPAKIIAVDWSENMLKEAQKKAGKLVKSDVFEFQKIDLTKPFPWSDNFFDAEVFNLSINYLPHPGWQHALKEIHRTVKPGGYVYISVLLKDWNFSQVIKKHIPEQMIANPIACFLGLKVKKSTNKIDALVKKGVIEYPSESEFIDFQKGLGFVDIEKEKIFWGVGIATRARKVR